MLLMIVSSACSPGDSAKGGASSFVVKDSGGTVLTEVGLGESSISVTGQEGNLKGIIKKDKRKYYTSDNQMKYAVKFSDDGFKLRNSNEQLLWKVKWYDDKVKIANNEEMIGAYEIKLREEGKVKLERYDALVTEIRLSAVENSTTIGNKYEVQGCGVSLAPAILLINELKDYEKFILMAEIRAKGR